MCEIFLEAFKSTMDREGLSSDHPLDPGGQTFMGISRVYWPDWEGWAILDTEDIAYVTNRITLDRMVRKFYIVNFWHRFQGEKLAAVSPRIAAKVFDVAVNLYVTRAVKWLQRAVNILNDTEVLLIDGLMGSVTLNRLEHTLQLRPPRKEDTEDRIIKIIGNFQGAHYIEQMELHPKKKIFKGWLDRF